jgi:dsDNA-specific endonuclease/ATPase MutS2
LNYNLIQIFDYLILIDINQVPKNVNTINSSINVKNLLVKGELQSIEEKINRMQKEHDNLRSLSMEQLNEQLLDIEADTYAEFIRAGKLNENLSPVLQEIMAKAGDD